MISVREKCLESVSIDGVSTYSVTFYICFEHYFNRYIIKEVRERKDKKKTSKRENCLFFFLPALICNDECESLFVYDIVEWILRIYMIWFVWRTFLFEFYF